jgi:ribosome-associated translation inhibitor RaiA
MIIARASGAPGDVRRERARAARSSRPPQRLRDRDAREHARAGADSAAPSIMSAPFEITFHGMAPSPAVERAIAHGFERIEHVVARVEHGRVWIALPHRHHRRGNELEVRVVVSTRGRRVTASDRSTDVYVAIANAFLAVQRQLAGRHLIRRRELKQHAA